LAAPVPEKAKLLRAATAPWREAPLRRRPWTSQVTRGWGRARVRKAARRRCVIV